MSKPIPSHAIVIWTPPVEPSEFFAKRDLQIRIESAYERGVGSLDLGHLLKDHPVLIPDAYDLAMTAEKVGRKDVADAVRRHVVSVIPASPASPSNSDARFLTQELTGEYAVGVKKFYLEDASRNEKDLGHDVDRTRRVMIDVHYPATPNKEVGYRIQPTYANGPPLKVDGGWTRSQPGIAPVPEKKFPVVLFSPGWGCSHDFYQHIVEELASHGFCVVSVNSPFTSGFTCGDTAFLGHDQPVLPDPEPGDEAELMFATEVMNKAEDLKFVMKQIKLDAIEGLEGVLDKNSIGVLGHSLGGSAGVQLSRSDKTVKAGINLDGKLSGDDTNSQLENPFLNIITNGMIKPNNEIEEGIIKKFKEVHTDSHKLILHNADHMDFSSYDLFDWKGEPPDETQAPVRNITNNYVCAFFKTHLKGEPSELFNEKTVCKVIETYDHAIRSATMAHRLLNT